MQKTLAGNNVSFCKYKDICLRIICHTEKKYSQTETMRCTLKTAERYFPLVL